MSQCVPDWHISTQRQDPEFPDGLGSTHNVFSASKSKLWDHQHQQFCGRHELPEHVPDYNEVAELTWVNGHLALQGLVSKAPNRHHYRSSGLGCHWVNDNHDQASDAEKEVDGTLHAIVLHEATRCDKNGPADAVANLPTLVDDVVPWFQCPLNDFNEQDAANAVGLLRKVSEEDIMLRGKRIDGTVRSSSEAERVAATPAAANPANTQSFDDLVRCNIHSDQCNNYMANRSATAGDDDDDGDERHEEEKVVEGDNANGSMNFSHFSRPAVMMKANLHVLEAARGPTNIQRVRQQCGYMNENRTDPHEPRHPQQQDAGNVSASDGNVPASIAGSSNGLGTGEISPSAFLHVARKAARSLPSTVISDGCITKAPDQDLRLNCSMSGSAREIISETCDAQDFTFTSSSGCSPNNRAVKCGKEMRWKRKKPVADEDWGCQSEDVEDESAQPMKKSQARRPGSTKRSRAAAVHNLSERRRRDRINERMKALQKLIPNSSKTDKASMLDEAIEYLKHLQAQLQMMSFRSGLNIAPVMMPLGMQPLQMSLLASLGQMGLGMGMGLMDMNSIAAAAGCGVVPMQGTGAHSLQPAAFVQPTIAAFSAAPADRNDRMQSPAVPDPYTAFMLCQRQPMNMEVYNTMAQLQQQLQRHPNHWLPPLPQQERSASKPG